MDLKENTFIYIADPMCSWCYGFKGEFEKLRSSKEGEYTFELLMGGLRPYTKKPMDDYTIDSVKHHWEEVHNRTGREFSTEFIDTNKDFIYDTEVPSRAVVVVNELAPEVVFDFFDDVQKAFYLQGKDTNDVNTYLELCEKHKISTSAFQSLFNNERARYATKQQFEWARKIGVTGFPTVVLFTNNNLYAISLGYSDYEKMNQAVMNTSESKN
ncbi:MAG: DsbA family protein [Cyclobacteriaceae bacterium]|nr:DsbA family protein [Cyclobacteriaceae bacterium]